MQAPQNFSSFMPERPFGMTGLRVPPLCIGCAALGDMPETFTYAVTEEQSLATIRAIFVGPIRFLDTAASYGDGESERRLGMVLRERSGLPPGFVLATKADRNLQTGDAPTDLIERARRIEEMCTSYNIPLAAAALQFSLRDPRINSTIVGISRPERLSQTLELARHPIPEDLWTELVALGVGSPSSK